MTTHTHTRTYNAHTHVQTMAPWPGNIVGREPILNFIHYTDAREMDEMCLYYHIQDTKHMRGDYRLFSVDRTAGMVLYYDQYESDDSSEDEPYDQYQYDHDREVA